MDSGGLAHKVSEVSKDSVRNWAGGLSCGIFVKTLTSFCLLSENQSEVEWSDDGLSSRMISKLMLKKLL